MTTTIKDGFNKIREMVSRREHTVSEYAAASAARSAAITEAQRHHDEWDRPRRELARLKAESMARSAGEEQAVAAMENELHASPPRELARFAAVVDRLIEVARATPPPTPREAPGASLVGGMVAPLNLKEIERHRAVTPALLALRAELRPLYLAPVAEIDRRLPELRQALEAAVAGSAFEEALP